MSNINYNEKEHDLRFQKLLEIAAVDMAIQKITESIVNRVVVE